LFRVRPIAGGSAYEMVVEVKPGGCYTPRQRLISSERAPEAGDRVIRQRYEFPVLLERRDEVCAMRGE
jgi:hypothetical protein